LPICEGRNEVEPEPEQEETERSHGAVFQHEHGYGVGVVGPGDAHGIRPNSRLCGHHRNGGRVSDTFTVTVKAVPVVVTAISDVADLAVGKMRGISLSGAFQDPDGDDRWVSQVEMSDPGVVWAWPSADSLTLTVEGSEAVSSTVTVHAQDSDGNAVRDTFAVTVTD